MAPREGIELVLMNMGRTGPLLEPRRRPQAGKSGYPRSQNADSSPRAQGAPGLGLAEKQRGKCEAPRAPSACGLGRRVAVNWTWASPLPHAASATARLEKSLHAEMGHDYLRSWRPTVGLLWIISTGGREPPLSISPCFASSPPPPSPWFVASHGSHKEVFGCGEQEGSPGGA